MKTVVLLSGGLDSAVALAAQNEDFSQIEALTVDYGQRHHREIRAASDIASFYNVTHTVSRIDPILFKGSALTGTGPVPARSATQPDSTYVPARNTVLLALAAARAESIGARTVVIGANADDANAYPDCRRGYIEAFRDVLQRGTLGHVWVQAPLLSMSKRDIIDRAQQLGVPVDLTWSCYVGGDQPCGQCGACQTREVTA
jgi:7-cyano-7-deazaguanine synthase